MSADVSPLSGEAIIALARRNSVSSRKRLFEAIDEIFQERKRVLNDEECFLITEILKGLVGQFERDVRRALSERLADRTDVPPELLSELANDEVSVAFPILARSKVLSDEVLIEVILNRSRDHQLAIALRPELSEEVSDALIHTEAPDVVQTLLENPNARISHAAHLFLVEKARRNGAYRLPLLLRQDLPADLHDRLLSFVSAALRQHICGRYRIAHPVVDEHVAAAARSTAAGSSGRMWQCGAELAGHLAKANQITPDFLLRTLRSGEVELFELLIAEMSGLRLQLVQRFVHEPGFAGMTVVLRALDFSREQFSSIFLLIRANKRADRVVPPDEWESGLGRFDSLTTESCGKALSWWRLEEGYLRALRTLEET